MKDPGGVYAGFGGSLGGGGAAIARRLSGAAANRGFGLASVGPARAAAS